MLGRGEQQAHEAQLRNQAQSAIEAHRPGGRHTHLGQWLNLLSGADFYATLHARQTIITPSILIGPIPALTINTFYTSQGA